MSDIPRWSNSEGRIDAGLAILPFAALLSWMYLPVIRDMAGDWYRNPNNSHGFLVPLVSAYFLWTRRRILGNADAKPWAWGIVPLVVGLLMFVGGSLGAAHTTLRLSLLAVVGGAVLFVCGREIFRVVSLPLLYLLFMVPLPAYLYDAVAFPLKAVVAKSSVAAMQTLGMTVFREGNLIVFPEITLQIADACSGIRSLYSLLAVGVAFSAIMMTRPWKRVALVVSVIPISVFANGLRVVVTGILARRFGAAATNGIAHEAGGLGVFVLAIVILCVTGVALEKIGKDRKP